MTDALAIVCDAGRSLDRRAIADALPAETITGSRLERTLPAAVDAVTERGHDRVAIVTPDPESYRQWAVENRLHDRGVDSVTWVDARLGRTLPEDDRVRVVAAATRAALRLAPPTRDERSSTADTPLSERVAVVDAPDLAGDLATHTPVTLVSETPVGRRRPNVRTSTGTPLELFADDDGWTVLLEREGTADRITVDQVVWPGYDGPNREEYGVHTHDDGVVESVLTVARDRAREPVSVDHEACVAGRRCVTGCRACELVCPHDAISISSSDGDAVAIDPDVCTDCGICLGSCPTDALSSPRSGSLETLARATTDALQTAADPAGRSRLAMIGRRSRPVPPVIAYAERAVLPTVVHATIDGPATIPVPVRAAPGVHASLLLFALAAGAGGVVLVGDPRSADDALERPAEEARQTLADLGVDAAVASVVATDAESVRTTLGRVARDAPLVDEPLEQAADTPATLSARAVETLADAPRGVVSAPALGSVTVDADACTLCSACDSLCPTGAIEQPDASTLTVDPAACVGCGICTACPEDAIDVQETVSIPIGEREPVVDADPVVCVSCDRPFTTAAGIASVRTALAGADLPGELGLEHCPDCRRVGVRG